MATTRLTVAQLQEALDLVAKHGNVTLAAAAAGLPRATFQGRYQEAKRWASGHLIQPPTAAVPLPEPPQSITDKVRERLRRGDCTLAEVQAITGMGERATLGLIEDMKSEGFNVHQFGDKWSLSKTVPLPGAPSESTLPTLISRPDNTFLIGATGDQHLCSKYHRPDVLNDLYDRYAKAGVQCVYNTGNWIDGECRFNKHDLLVHGMEQQLRYLAKHYPQRPGITTYAVAGDDHEGWYAQREGVDIGRYAERIMREAGREDWVNLGYMEAHVRLVNANSGKHSILSVVHPGGGSAYAVSYTIQKIIEVLDGGEKPAVGLYGHYHKLWAGNIRNVWCLQTGTCKDQDPFMRKKKIDAHVGGAIVRMEQDPDTGAITSFEPNMIRYFNKGYYNDRWSMAGEVVLPERSVA